MNINHTLTCTTCGEDTDVRFGLSNRKVQPLRFPCPHCGSRIDVTLELGNGFTFEGAKLIDDRQPKAAFDNTNPFVDLHLDFPVWPDKYVPGNTPFIVAFRKVKKGTPEEKIALLQRHGQRVSQLDALAESSSAIHQIIRLYHGRNKQLFITRAAGFLGEKPQTSLLGQDLNALLYRFVSTVFEPFVDMNLVRQNVDDFFRVLVGLADKDRAAINAMMQRFEDSGFLTHLQKDCLELYPEIFSAELALRAAFFLDVTDDQGRGVPARISTADFKSYKDLYKDIAEVFGRQLVLVAAINNLEKRGDADAFFKPKDGNALSSLDKFAEKTLSDRFKYLDDCWYPIDTDIVDTGVRNAIAHYLTEYDDLTQEITYFPEKEGIRQERGETMHLLDFMRMILLLFRQMHSLHHLIKALLYYDLLIRKKA
ncbi:hypothetical protein [Devosia sp.]|uniref:hypothetical protein n=1 Tax=Devosia sp. TaxID=1871048 RepID=UPI001AD431A1|nr:hypothetical protein [Devosia sp.]MBN9335392.1 hypothetical protein [Devosia sp.]